VLNQPRGTKEIEGGGREGDDGGCLVGGFEGRSQSVLGAVGHSAAAARGHAEREHPGHHVHQSSHQEGHRRRRPQLSDEPQQQEGDHSQAQAGQVLILDELEGGLSEARGTS